MKKLNRIAMFTTLLATTAITHADTITIAADEWCPYNCAPDSAQPGYAVELTQEALKPYGHTVKYEVLPWTRAVKMTEEGELNAVIGSNPNSDPTLIYPKNEFGIMTWAIFVRADDPWRFTTPESLKGRSIGLINDYQYSNLGDYLRENPAIAKLESIGGDDAREKNIQKLLNKRIDTFIENGAVMSWTLAQTQREGQLIDVGASDPLSLFIAFSPKNPQSAVYAQQLSDGIDKLRQSGRLAEILKSYHLTDWKK
jgi:polar amino acid transport system substrate-binding protein